MGIQSGIAKDDDVIGAYRCHGLQLVRGDSVRRIIAEMMGFDEGTVHGKGGSMHLYTKTGHFWGGTGARGSAVCVCGAGR